MTNCRSYLLTLGLLGGVGCASESAGPIEFPSGLNPTVAATVEGLGVDATIHLQINNPSQTVYTYGSCTRWVEHLEGSSWVRLGNPNDPCPSDIAILGAWQVHHSVTQLEQSLPVGSYRFRFSFGKEPEPTVRVERASNPFEWPR